MQNFIHHLASKELPDAMQLANNSHQNWGETGVDSTTSCFTAHSNLKNWETFSKNTLKNKTIIIGKGVPCAVVIIMQMPKNGL